MNVLLIGMTGKSYLPYHIANELESLGATVYRVACTENSIEECQPYDYNVLEESVKIDFNYACRLQEGNKYVDVKNIIEFFNKKGITIDLIYYQQTSFYLKFNDISIPLVYYYTQPLKPYFPVFANVRSVFTAGPECINILKRSYRPEIYECKDTEKVFQWGYNEQVYPLNPDFDNRDIFIGFKGATSSEGGSKSKDYNVRHIYDDRIRIIRECEKVFKKKFVWEHSEHYSKNLEFMHRVKFALNIPGTGCYLNQRTYYVMGMGCVLLQYNNRYLNDFGFIDGENCIIFDNVKEIKKKIKSYDIEKIRKNGIKFANENTYSIRAKQIAESILEGKCGI